MQSLGGGCSYHLALFNLIIFLQCFETPVSKCSDSKAERDTTSALLTTCLVPLLFSQWLLTSQFFSFSESETCLVKTHGILPRA